MTLPDIDDSFEPVLTAGVTSKAWTENKTKEFYYPDSGNRITIPYIECTSANEAAVNVLLDEIKALCVTFDRKIWTASKDAGLFPGMVVRITARTDVVAAEVGAAEPDWITLTDCSSTTGWDRYQDCPSLVLNSSDYVIGDASLQFAKGGGIDPWTGIMNLWTPLAGSPFDASDGEHVSLTFKVPTGTSFTSWGGAVLYVGTDIDNCVKYTWDTTDFVAGSWITLTKEIDDIADTVGDGMDAEAIRHVRFYLDTLADMSTVLDWILLDNIRIV